MMFNAERGKVSQKRSWGVLEVGPQDPEEAGFTYIKRRASEVCSQSTCNSDTIPVERIHSGIPVPPEARKTEGADCPFVNEITGNCLLRPSDDGGGGSFRENDSSAHRRRGVFSSSVPRSTGSPQLAKPESYTAKQQVAMTNIIQAAAIKNLHHTAAQPVDARVGHHVQPNAGALTSLTWDALRQQMDLLQRDEQALLGELRLLRREYDERVAATQQRSFVEQGRAGQVKLSVPSAEDRAQLGVLMEQESRLRPGGSGAPRVATSFPPPTDNPSVSQTMINGPPGRSLAASRRTVMPPPPPPTDQAAAVHSAARGARQNTAMVAFGASDTSVPRGQAAIRGSASVAVQQGRFARLASEALPVPVSAAALTAQLADALSYEAGNGPAFGTLLTQLLRQHQHQHQHQHH